MLYDPNWAPAPAEVKPEDWRIIIDKAADLIEKGWTQHTFVREHRTWYGKKTKSYCIVGALRDAAAVHNPMPHDAFIMKQTAHMKINDALGGNEAMFWNDHPKRTKKEVVAKLREVARS